MNEADSRADRNMVIAEFFRAAADLLKATTKLVVAEVSKRTTK